MSIKVKLIAGFIIVAFIAAGIGLLGMVNINKMALGSEFMYQNQTMPLGQLVFITESFQRQRINIRDMVNASDTREIEAIEATLNELSATVLAAYEKYSSTMVEGKGKELYGIAMTARDAFRASFQEQLDLAKQNRDQEALALIEGRGKQAAFAYQEALNTLVQYKMGAAEQQFESNIQNAKMVTLLVSAILIGGVLLALVLGLTLSLSISTPLGVAVRHLAEMAKGDLRQTIAAKYLNRSDEIGALSKALEAFSKELRRIVEDIQSASDQVASGSEQISSSAQQLSQGAAEQAASAEEVSASVEEMSATVKQNADNSKATEAIASKSAIDAGEGGKAVQESVLAMNEIASRISIIDEIARQTNLLALN
ncbi:MAG TPA: hypothetical protein DCG47_04105, partial [Spirochaetaceae bacterium]|nr:hypothetical protein [Spirochaetaceae bacterium]